MLVSALGLAAAALTRESDARACGCTSPPVPPPVPTANGYAVNQRGEQIIFEVEPGFVTAHVLIQYAGAPDKFAWIVPVPSVPELSLSHETTFGLLDSLTAPKITVSDVSRCPSPEWKCTAHAQPPPCPKNTGSGAGGSGSAGTGGGSAGAAGGVGSMNVPGVDVINQQVVGSYDTVTFSAGDAASAVTWLNLNGFIVNDTMSPFMMPYVEQKMLFVASKLVPGAGTDSIKPLKMRYAADAPMIPLRLTAVAAEPHMGITAFVFGSSTFLPKDHPILSIAAKDLDRGTDGRVNYPMLLSRTIDEAGGDGYFIEFASHAPAPGFDSTPCCANPNQYGCQQVPYDGKCECPTSASDAKDCGAIPDLVDGAKLYTELRTKYSTLTRITTRLSPEQMTHDPTFIPGQSITQGKLTLAGEHYTVQPCSGDVIDKTAHLAVLEGEGCASVYCGKGVCVGTTQADAACACDTGYVARHFLDLDGKKSVTCVPDKGLVSFSAGGLVLPSACLGVTCGDGVCVDVGGFPTCRCAPGTAGSLSAGVAPTCATITSSTASPGGENRTGGVLQLKVCAPAPPSDCGTNGWLVPATNVAIKGVTCLSSEPDPKLLVEPPLPPPNVCPPTGSAGYAGSGAKGGATGSGAGASNGVGAGKGVGGAAGSGADATGTGGMPSGDAPSADEASGGCSVGDRRGAPSAMLALLVAAAALRGARRRR